MPNLKFEIDEDGIIEQGIRNYGETVAKHLTEEELTRWLDNSLKVQTRIIKKDNYWL